MPPNTKTPTIALRKDCWVMIRPNLIRFGVTLALLVAGQGLVQPSEHAKSSTAGQVPSRDALYVALDSSFVLAVVDGNLYTGLAGRDLQVRQIPQFIGPQGRFRPQMVGQVQCAFARHITFAVPLSRQAGQVYSCNGVRFTIDRCSPGRRCDNYTVTAQCAHFENGKCSEDASADQPVLIYRFRGSSRTGITEVNFDPRSERHRLVLRQGSGIFQAHSPLRTSSPPFRSEQDTVDSKALRTAPQ